MFSVRQYHGTGRLLFAELGRKTVYRRTRTDKRIIRCENDNYHEWMVEGVVVNNHDRQTAAMLDATGGQQQAAVPDTQLSIGW